MKIQNQRKQAGYLLEVPLILMLTAIVLAVLLPMLSVIFKKILLVITAGIWIAGLYYMIVIPGWQPESYSSKRLRYPWNLLAFIVLAAALIFITGAYVIYG